MKFLAIKAALPSRRIENADHLAQIEAVNRARLGAGGAAALAGLVAQLFALSGSQTRYARAEGETARELTTQAATAAIEAAGVAPDSIDLLIYVGVGRGFLEPATATLFIDRLGLTRATGFDLLDACASWARAVHVARALMLAGFHRRILILNGEFSGEYLDYRFDSVEDLRHRFAQFTIGEAATATLLEHDGDDGGDDGGAGCAYHASFRTDAAQHRLCMIPLPNFAQYTGESPAHARALAFFSDSQPLLKQGIALLAAHHATDPELAGYRPDIVFGHAASDTASLQCAEAIGLDRALLYLIHARFGNVVSASVPLAMACAQDEGRLRHGDRILVGVASAGLSTAFLRLRFLTG